MTHPIVIEVGHDPDLTATLHNELSCNQPWPIRRLSSRTPLRRSEIAMLKRTDNGGWEIDYVVSPGSENEITELQRKLKSKMDTAKVLGAFLTGLAFFAGKAVIDHEPRPDWYPWVAGTGMALLAFAVAAYIVTMFLYDSLLMPTAFWPTAGNPEPTTDKSTPESTADKKPSRHDVRMISRWYRVVGTGQRPRRPPSSAATVILHSMQRAWGGMFVPATVAAGAGAALIGIGLAQPSGTWWAMAISAVLAVTVAVWGFYVASRPDLGHSD